MNLTGYDLDVRLAGEVQKLLFPKGSRFCSWCCIGVKFRMAQGLGGDYFDFITLPDGCQFVMVGDVTGHGLHASVVMSLLYGFIYHASISNCDPIKLARDANAFLGNFAKRSQELDHYFSSTCFCGVIDPQTLQMRYVNAGHVPPLIRRGDNLLELAATAPPLGFFEEPEIVLESFSFAAKDRMLLYTDGIVEAADRAGNLFGLERLKGFVRQDDNSHAVFLERLFNALDTFKCSDSQADDCTAITIDFR